MRATGRRDRRDDLGAATGTRRSSRSRARPASRIGRSTTCADFGRRATAARGSRSSTAAGVAVCARDLVGPPEATPLPLLGELLAKRGDRAARARDAADGRVARSRAACARTCRSRSSAPCSATTRSLAASWLGSPGETRASHRDSRAATPRAARAARPRSQSRVPAELRDLPPLADARCRGRDREARYRQARGRGASRSIASIRTSLRDRARARARR